MKALFLIAFLTIAPLFVHWPLAKEPHILFVGDIFLDRYIRQSMSQNGNDYPFLCADKLLQSADLVIGNLEGPITDSSSRSLGTEPGSPDNFVFTFPDFSAALLAKHHVQLVDLANNHANNFGQSGYEQTKKYLSQAGVSYFDDQHIYRTKLGEQELSFIAYNQFGGDSVETVANKIKKEVQEKRQVIIFAHWGEEYSSVTRQQQEAAKTFASAGAALIVGSHPHVVQSHVMIDETPVYYSLGNFIFDQYWNEAVRNGLALEVTLSQKGLQVLEHPILLQRTGQSCPE